MYDALPDPTGPTGPAMGMLGPTGPTAPPEPVVIGLTGPTGPPSPVKIDVRHPIGPTGSAGEESGSTTTKVVQLAEVGQHEVIAITELEPSNGRFIGKHINRDGSLTQYPFVKWWRQRVAHVPAIIPQLFVYLREARARNICLIRGVSANAGRQPTQRQKAGMVGDSDRGDHGFIDEPTRLFFLDGDGIKINWRDNPERAVRAVVAQLGEPWASTSFVWFFSATHGLELVERDTQKRWTGKISDGKLRVRFAFLTERPLDEREAVELTNIAKARVPEFDRSICFTVQPNYIKHWVDHPDRDVLGNIPTIGWVNGTHDALAVPDDLTHTARWAKAQGHGNIIADHPDAESAVRGIGSDGRLREHMLSATVHLLRANPVPDVTSFIDHSLDIADKLRSMIERYHEDIGNNLLQHGRHWSEVENYLSGMSDFALWCLNHPGLLYAKTIKLDREELAEKGGETREAIFARVARTIERAYFEARANRESPLIMLLVAPTGSRKSTLIRAAAVRYVNEKPNKTVVILMPRHKLGDEQIELLRREHPGYSAAVWRGRHAWNPHVGDGREEKMCRRSEEVEAVEAKLLDVEHTLCKRGRGKKAIKCPLFDTCAFQQQKKIKADIWFAAHEQAVHEMPKAFGKVGWVIFDENPLDAFLFGIDIDHQVTLELDTLRTPMPIDEAKFGTKYMVPLYGKLMKAREAVYRALDRLQVPGDSQRGVAVPWEALEPFIVTALGSSVPWKSIAQIVQIVLAGTNIGILIQGGGPHGSHWAKDMHGLTWRGKTKPDIRPDMTKEELKIKLQDAAFNTTIKKEVTLWELIETVNDNNTYSQGIRDTPIERLKTMLQEAAVNGSIEKEVPVWELIEIPIRRGVSYGRIQVHRGTEGRLIRMVGLNELAKGWNVPTLICDATGDANLLKAIWPQLEEAEPHGWEQLPRPANVRVFQCVDRTISKWAVAVEGKDSKERERRAEGARRLYAAMLMKALEYGGADVGVIIYKSTKEWILKNYFVPDWLKLVHWGDVTGTNTLQRVRALFVIGRPLASAEAVTRQTEALFGAHIPQREYVTGHKQGRIPTVPDAVGNNCIRVDVWKHPHPTAERLRRQITEGGIIQAVGRARAGLREANEPLDLHLWTDVPVPELGPVEPVLWRELEAGGDGVMLGGGIWLECLHDAARAYDGLITVEGLKSARERRAQDGARGVGVLYIDIPICKTPTPRLIRYQRAGKGLRPQRALALMELAAARAWLEEKLGPLVRFEAVKWGEKDEAV